MTYSVDFEVFLRLTKLLVLVFVCRFCIGLQKRLHFFSGKQILAIFLTSSTVVEYAWSMCSFDKRVDYIAGYVCKLDHSLRLSSANLYLANQTVGTHGACLG